MEAERVGSGGRILIYLLGLTWRISRIRPSTGRAKKSVLFAFWHGVQLPLIYTHRNMGIRIMISRSRDGSMVASLCEKMGFNPVRGSTSRGGASAAKEQIDALKKGFPAAITPDGPKGPPCVAKPGVSLVPRKAGVSVVPYGVSAFPAVKLSSWDGFLIPLPFARLVVSEGRPIPPHHSGAETITAAIKAESARAALHTNPAARFVFSVTKSIAAFLTVAAEAALLFRGTTERRERRGLISRQVTRPVWMHGASLGELRGLLPLIDSLKKADVPVFVTCTTPSGREFLWKRSLPSAFLPLDLPLYVNRFLERLNPSALVLAETEFWPVLLHETVSRGITAGMINARLSEKSVRGYKLIKPLFMGIFSCFRGVLARTKEDSERFYSLGVEADVAGDSKFLLPPVEPDPQWRDKIAHGSGGVIVAGSTRKGEERVILQVAQRSGLTPLLVPRHESRIAEVMAIARKEGFSPDLWSENPKDSTCLVVDVKGVLAGLYGIADVAFVGGTLAPIGGHNIMEPLAHNTPVLVGPSHFHFREVVERSVATGLCRVFSTVDEGVAAVRELIDLRGVRKEQPDPVSVSDKVAEKVRELLRKMEIPVDLH